MSGEYAVIGLGRFGRSVALQLARRGERVLGVDRDQGLVEAAASDLDAVVRADTTDEEVFAELHLERMSCVVVAIGVEAVEASILTTALLRQRGVPRIVARAVSDLHARVLRLVGAHQVINPEAEMGGRLARQLAQPRVLEQLELGEDVDLAEVEVPPSFVGRTLADLDVRRKQEVSVVAIRREGRTTANVQAGVELRAGDVLVVIGDPAAIRRLGTMV